MDQLVALISQSPLAGAAVVAGLFAWRLYRDQREDSVKVRTLVEAQTAASVAQTAALVELRGAIVGLASSIESMETISANCRHKSGNGAARSEDACSTRA